MKIKYSYFESVYYSKASKFIPGSEIIPIEADSWQDFAEELKRFSDLSWNSKQEAPCISPAFYETLYRKNENVKGWSFLALDYDDGAKIEEAMEFLMEINNNFIIYSTASARPDKDKFRVLVSLTRDVLPEEMEDTWAGAYELFNKKTDIQCKDKSRGYYVPGIYPNATKFFTYYSEGADLNPDILISLAPVKEIIEKEEFIQTSVYHWSGILDCPFVKGKWVSDYQSLTTGTGVHYKGMYDFMIKVAGFAKFKGYQIQNHELKDLCIKLDQMSTNKFNNREWDKEIQNAINFIY